MEKNVKFIPVVSHKKSIDFIINSSALLLIIPDVHKNTGIVPGKLYEYLATRKPVLCIGDSDSDAAKIISACNAGKTFNVSSQEQMETYLLSLIDAHKNNHTTENSSPEILKYSREAQAKTYSELILSV